MKFMIFILATLWAGVAHAETTVRDCEVQSVRRLNVSNGVEVQLSGCSVRVGNWESYRLQSVRLVDTTDAIVAQITTLATSALANGLKVELLLESNHLQCDRRFRSCESHGFGAFEIYKGQN